MEQTWKQALKSVLAAVVLATVAYLVSMLYWTSPGYAAVKNPNCDPNIGDCKMWLSEIEAANLLANKGYEPGALEWNEDADQEGRFCVNNECGYGFQKTKVIIGKDKDANGVPTAKADSRTPVTAAEHNIHSGIGKTMCLDKDGEYSVGTAFLAVKQDVVVSDAHSFFNDKEPREPAEVVTDCKFIITNEKGAVVFESTFESVELGGLKTLDPDPTLTVDDWAVLKLSKEASSYFTAMGTIEVDKDTFSGWQEFDIIGYAGDKKLNPNLKYRSKGLVINTKIGGARYPVFEHTADTNGGTSGAPMFVTLNGKPYFFGIHVSPSVYDRNIGLALQGEFEDALGRAIK